MTPQCSQHLTDGQRCNAPAVNGSTFCRHHDPQRPPRPVEKESGGNEPLVLPPLTDKYSVLLALDEIIHALAEGRIKRSVAETLLSGMKLVSRLVNELTEEGLLDPEVPEPTGQGPASPEPQLSHWQPDGQVAARMVSPSSSDHPTSFFSASHPHSAEPEMDSATECLIRELVAQSQELVAKHVPRT
ncbi:MAG TPA: hypothetical protein VN753_09350 [Terracidiphilus sp.]|nr:hypothetical protein [Terracidiphilus sp.]